MCPEILVFLSQCVKHVVKISQKKWCQIKSDIILLSFLRFLTVVASRVLVSTDERIATIALQTKQLLSLLRIQHIRTGKYINKIKCVSVPLNVIRIEYI